MKKRAGKWKQVMKKKKTIFVLIFAAGAGAVSFGIYSVKGTPASGVPDLTIPVQETQAKTGNISNTIVGTGNLAYGEGTAVTIPSGITVEEVLVEAGDSVSKGDVLATVDSASVIRAMASVQEEIDALDEEIDDSKDDTDAQSVTSKVDGRVKRIYVKEGQQVSECMAEQGALLLLSLDGYLAAEVKTDAEIAKGDSILVIRADGTQKEGSVESVSKGSCIVLCPDSGVGVEEEITIADEQGNVLGNGKTYIHQPLAITAAVGAVEEICVSEDEKVYAGTELLTLDNDGQSLEYQEQMAEREELAENLQELIVLSQSGAITAESAGIIQSVNISAEGSQSKAEITAKTSEVRTEYTASKQLSQPIVAVSTATGTRSRQNSKSLTMTAATGATASLQASETVQAMAATTIEEAETQELPLVLEIKDSGAEGQGAVLLETPKTGEKPQTHVKTPDGSVQGTVSWKPGDQVFAAETSYQASIVLYAAEGYCFTEDSISKIKTGVLSGLTVSEDGKELNFQITYPFTEAEKQKDENQGNGTEDETNSQHGTGNQNDAENEEQNGGGKQNGTEDEHQEGNGNNSEKQDGNSADNQNGVGTQADNSISNGAFSQQSAGAGQTTPSAGSRTASVSSASSSGTTSSSTLQTNGGEDSATSSSQVTAFTMAESNAMILSVSVDELDINSVSEEQEATITMDALEGENFTGTVTQVGSSASSSGGVAKYTVEITVPRDERMKEGMNASAVITIEERENVVTIPVNALQERKNRVFVYTETDSDGNLSGEQEVTTGLSDGDTVEIIQGLSEGDTVYYQKTGNISSQGFGKVEGGFDREKGQMRQGGFGGDMPQGSFPGGESGGGMPQGMPNWQE